VHVALVAYFDQAAQAEVQRKYGDIKPDALLSVRADEKQRLTSGPMPIDQAMQTLGQKGRMGAGPAIVPAPEKVDISPMQGWVKMPVEVPAPLAAAASAAASAAPAPAPAGAPSAAPSSSTAPPAGSAPPPPNHP
ncbi:MAG TPA: hypothetical protein VMI75_08320, partial [Polyangiaceae bacterium]|nr:hypothetical protein [Polyangiaceae bacterium]